MGSIVIDGFDFGQAAAEKYWSLPRNKANPKEELYKMVYSGQYIGSEKKDGAYFRLIKGEDGEISLQGRSKSTVTKDFLDKHTWVPQLNEFFEALPNGTCLLGEIYYPNKPGSNEITKIMGCKEPTALKRQNGAWGKVHYWVFDVWAWNGKSLLKTSYEERIPIITDKVAKYANNYVEIATFFEGEDIIDNLNRILGEGGEGVVITKRDSHPEPGKRPARKTLKVKKELQNTIDVVICGIVKPTRLYTGKEPESWPYWQNERTNELSNTCKYGVSTVQSESKGRTGSKVGIDTWVPITKKYYYGWISAFQIGCYKDGKLVKIGQVSGITDEVAKNWKDYIGTVVEISSMEILKTGGLRHPRIMKYRPDKDKLDCKWEDIFE